MSITQLAEFSFDALGASKRPEMKKKKEAFLLYCIFYKNAFSQCHAPFLLPFLGPSQAHINSWRTSKKIFLIPTSLVYVGN